MYVHCKEGTGRSVAVTLCWLVAAREMDSLAAQEYLSGKRHVRKVALLASRCPDGVLPRRRKKLWILSDQKLRVENVNALLDIHMANFERYMIEKNEGALARSHSFYHAKGLGLFAVPCQSIAKLYTANVGHLKGAAQVRHKRARRYSRKWGFFDNQDVLGRDAEQGACWRGGGKEKEFKDVTGVMEGVQSYFDRDVSSCCTALSVDGTRSYGRNRRRVCRLYPPLGGDLVHFESHIALTTLTKSPQVVVVVVGWQK
uniref:Tyrosine specific protein phosphatases domain-containing protein n=1 Tax=Peronospora matthiolae TaxID=2874970 RepID=A0AAV1T475_9STRA